VSARQSRLTAGRENSRAERSNRSNRGGGVRGCRSKLGEWFHPPSFLLSDLGSKRRRS